MGCIAGVGIGFDSLDGLRSAVLESGMLGNGAEVLPTVAAEASTKYIGLSPENVPLAMTGIAASFAVKEYLYRATIRIGRETRSPVLIANAWHHRSDALSSAVAGVG